jgi:hypothetical protein
MVYYFSSNIVTPAAYIYVGKDKVESKFVHAFICALDLGVADRGYR